MTLRRYERYRDSGVEWLGAVPAHWTVTRLKFIAHVQTGVAKGKDNTGQKTIVVPYLRVANVQDGYLDLEDVATIEIPADDLPRYRLRAGDVLMNEGGDFDKLGRGHVWDGSIDPCIHQNHVFAVRPFGVSPQWLNLVTGSAYAQFYFMSRSKQSTNLASISSTNVMELPVVLPPSAEQAAITEFLARDFANVDTLIAEQQRLIELLTEKRRAVIARAVTKGLNPSVPMKDSGVEWLDEVPAHWTIGAIKRFFQVLDGCRIPLSSEERADRQGHYPYYGASGIIDWIDSFLFSEDLVLVSEDGANLVNRATPIAFVARGSYWVNNHAHILKPPDTNLVFWAERIEVLDLLPFVTGAAQPKLTIDALENLIIAVPPSEPERASIDRFIVNEMKRFDELLLKADEAVSLLQERRSALISAAVTGQIDVRQPNPTESTSAAHLQPHD